MLEWFDWGLLAWLGFSGSTSEVDKLAAVTSNSPKLNPIIRKATKLPKGQSPTLVRRPTQQPEIEELTLSNTTTDDVSVVSQASSSIESFMTKLGGNAENSTWTQRCSSRCRDARFERRAVCCRRVAWSAEHNDGFYRRTESGFRKIRFADLMDDEAAPMTDEANAKADPATPNSTETLGFVQENMDCESFSDQDHVSRSISPA